MGYVLSLDLGTTALKLLLLDAGGRTVHVASEPYPTRFPEPDRIQQEPAEWVKALCRGAGALWERCTPGEIEAVGFSGHMSSVVAIDRRGEPVYPCMTLADVRSARQAAWLTEHLSGEILAATGNRPLNAFALPKLLWLRDEAPEAFARADVWLSAKDYLRFWLTGEAAQDVTDAYNSLCVLPETRRWNRPLIEAAGLSPALFPRLLEAYGRAGSVTAEAAALTGLLAGTPVFAGGADMACGALGMGLAQPGDATVSMGTNAPFMMMIERFDPAYAGALTCHAGAFPGQTYALGSHFNGGLVVNCLSKLLTEDGRIDYGMVGVLACEAEALPPGAGGVMALPFFAGSGSPYFAPDDRAALVGLSAATTRAQLLRAALEGVALNLRQSLELMRTLCPQGQTRVSLFGGGTRIPLWTRIIAAVFGFPVDVVQNPDASAVGGALLAGYGAGLYPDPLSLARAVLPGRAEVIPTGEDKAAYQALYGRYLDLYGALRPWYEKA
ncbi:MAG: hypothetical protein GX418_15850 [Clostridiales bacterium]|nr:hypothetical protein [Clostridiales bacterium]